MAILIDFIISILSSNVPTIKDWLDSHVDLQAKIDKAYQRALKKWCKNDIIRNEIDEKYKSIDNLREYFNGTSSLSESEKDLIKLWAQELRNDALTYSAILEVKIDDLSSTVGEVIKKLNLGSLYLADDIRKRNEALLSHVHDEIYINDKSWRVSRTDLISKISDLINNQKDIVLTGEGGSGKSAIIKEFCQSSQFPIVYFKAEQFNVESLNSLFSFSRDYNIAEVKDYFKSELKKYIIIDSAERLLRLKEKTNLELFVNTFHTDGWHFLFCSRNSSDKEIILLLNRILNHDLSIIRIGLLSDKDLADFGKSTKISLPDNKHLRAQLRNLFYLSRFAETKGNSSKDINEFKDSIWNQKVCGAPDEIPAIRYAREQCLFSIIKRYNETKLYTVPIDDLNINYDALDGLVRDEVLAREDHIGYTFAHDIYCDWGEERLLDKDWYQLGYNTKNFTETLGKDLIKLNAFSRWVDDKIEAQDKCVDSFLSNAIQDGLSHEWSIIVLIEVLHSTEYSNKLFKTYEEQLIAEDFKLLAKIINLLCTNCESLLSYVKINGSQEALMLPEGAGWEIAMEFLLSHFDSFKTNHKELLNKFIIELSHKADVNKELRHKVGLLLLKPYREDMERKAHGEDIFYWHEDQTINMIALYSSSLVQEMKAIIHEVVDHKWCKYNSPYYGLMKYIVKSDSTTYSLLTLIIDIPQEILSLLNLFWNKPEIANNDRYLGGVGPSSEVDLMWGLNYNFLITTDYFPDSALQTIIYPLLKYHPTETIDFIIKFMNEHIKYYAQHSWKGYECEECEITLPNANHKKVIGNSIAWNLYRGSSSTAVSYLLICIHMALEKYLLDCCEECRKNNDFSKVKSLIDRIFTNSESISLFAIIASVTTAYPKIFFDELLSVCSNINILMLDNERLNAESHSFFSGIYAYHPQLLKEREKSNKQPHHKTSLEQTIFSLQLQYDQDKKETGKLSRLYKLVDSLKGQVESVKDKVTAKFVISRLDYRSMEKTMVNIKGEINAIQLIPSLDAEQKQAQKSIQEDQDKFLPILRLSNWVIAKLNEDLSAPQNSPYDEDPLKSLGIAKTLAAIDWNKDGRGFLCLPSDRNIPLGVAAVMVRFYYKQMSDEDQKWCASYLLSGLEQPNIALASSIIKLGDLMQSMAPLVEDRPDLSDRLAKVLVTYSYIHDGYGGNRPCDIIACFVARNNLWQNHKDFMLSALKTFEGLEDHVRMALKSRTYNMDDYIADLTVAESKLCLISVFTGIDEIDKKAAGCLKKLAEVWDGKNKYKNWFTGSRTIMASVVVRYILSASKDSIPRLVDYFIPYVNNNGEDLLNDFILFASLYSRNDNFWIVWKALYPHIIKSKSPVWDDTINSYLFYPRFYGQIDHDWFKFDERGIIFYKAVANDRGYDIHVLHAIVNSCCTIAKGFIGELLPIIAGIVSTHDFSLPGNGEYMNHTLSCLRHILIDIVGGENMKKNKVLRDNIISLLSFMEKHGDSWAAEVKRNIS